MFTHRKRFAIVRLNKGSGVPPFLYNLFTISTNKKFYRFSHWLILNKMF